MRFLRPVLRLALPRSFSSRVAYAKGSLSSARWGNLWFIAGLLGVLTMGSPHLIYAQSPAGSMISDVDSADGPVPFALTVSGGVSLGAYEAGFLYYELEVLKQYPELLSLKSVAGASAGSLNGLLAILSFCGDHMPSPQDSLFWEVWIPLGFKQLFLEDKATALSVLSRDYFQVAAKKVQKAWNQGISPSCDVVLGVATTRVFPRNVSMADARLQLPRIEEKFNVRIQGRGYDRPPIARNYIDTHYGLEQTMLPENQDHEVAFASLRDITFASCSFPLAFPPLALRYCITTPNRILAPQCNLTNSIEGLFIDGGVLDNSPLRLAARTMGAGLRKSANGQYNWLDAPTLDHFDMPEHARFLFVTPDAADYPMYDELGRERVPESMSGMVKQLMATFVSTSRTKELYTLLEERPELRDRIFVPRRHYPTASGLLSAFFGFLETDFRIFDFYLGMYDARRNFDDDVRPNMAQRLGEAMVEPVYPEEEGMILPDQLSQWLPLQCMRHVFDDIPELRDTCTGPDLANFRVLLQVSLERVYDNCARLDTRSLPQTRNPACLAGARGEDPPHVIGTTWPVGFNWRRIVGENELEYILRLLAAHKFHFKDLGLSADEPWRARARIRQDIAIMAHTIASKQPLAEREPIRLAAEVAADFVVYSPAPHLTYVTVARQIELGYSGALHRFHILPESLRFNGALLLSGLGGLMTSHPGHFALGPVFGAEVQPRGMRTAILGARFVGRVGYLFSSGDSFLQRTCNHSSSQGFDDCSRLLVQVQAGVTAFDHVRLQLGAEIYPPLHAQETLMWSISPGVGLQF
jgi:predicted acylesterase/phospholipase RssA